MKANQTNISLKEIRSFYRFNCECEGRKFYEKEFEAFVNCCERDFYQWLSNNLKYFDREERDDLKID